MSASQSTTESMRAPSGIAVPERPCGYPEPSQFSWWWRTMGTTGNGKSTADRIDAPMSACFFISSYSPGVKRPGLLRMCSESPVCRDHAGAPRPPAPGARASAPIATATRVLRSCTRRMWPCVTWSFASTAIASVSTVELYRRRNSARCRFVSSSRAAV